MKIGLDDFTLVMGNIPFDAFGLLDKASELGVQGVQFSIMDSFASLEKDYLLKVKEHADKRNLYIEVGIGSCNPYSNCRAERDKKRLPAESLAEAINVSAIIGSPTVRTVIGFQTERLMKNPPLAKQIEATIDVLRIASRQAEDAGVTIALENHCVLTSVELRDLIETVDSRHVGVCFDTGNPLVMLEEPLEALENLLTYIHTTHLKDGIIYSSDEGASWIAAPLGEGFASLPSLIDRLYAHNPEINLNIEDLWPIITVPFFNEEFLDSLDHLSVKKMVQIIKWLKKGDTMIREGKIPHPDQSQGETGEKIVRDRIASNVQFVKKLLNDKGIQ